VVKLSPRHPKVKCSSPATTAGKNREKFVKKNIFCENIILLKERENPQPSHKTIRQNL
jgi:hypothetical protein